MFLQLKLEPRDNISKILHLACILLKDLIDILLPKATASTRLNELPHFANDLIDSEEPNCTKLITLSEEPNLEVPLKLNAEPNATLSNTDNTLLNLENSPATEKDDPSLA